MSITDLLKIIQEMTPEDKKLLAQALSSQDIPAEPAPKKVSRNKKNVINKFESSPIFNECKNDIKIDKKLSGNFQKTPRARRQKMIEIKCMKCGTLCKTDPSFVYYMSKDEYSFTCNKCLGGNR